MQLSRWHADLRIPTLARSSASESSALTKPELQTLQQGFCGITHVSTSDSGEVCTWHRLVDLQPPESTPDAGWMVFHNTELLEETGIHGVYREIWQRLPDSTVRMIALTELAQRTEQAGVRWLIAGSYAMRVRPAQAPNHLLEISYGRLDLGYWHLQRSSLPELEGQRIAFSLQRDNEHTAVLQLEKSVSRCAIEEWRE